MALFEKRPADLSLVSSEFSPVKITGVMDDAPKNTHLRPDLVLSYATCETLEGRPSPGWSNWGMDRTYVLFRGKPDIPSFAEKLKNLLRKNVDPERADMFVFHLQPLKGLHWITDFRGDIHPRGNRAHFYMFIWAAVRVLGYEDPIGARLKIPRGEGLREMTVIGVVKDFHVQPLHYKINPMAITLQPEAGFTLLIRYRPGQEGNALAFVRRTLAELVPEERFEVRFLDQEYAKGYLSEQKTGTLLAAFSLLAVIISSAGLLGLTAFTIGRRVKEIGIRKVLGASTTQVVLLLSREYLFIVLAANLIAWPVTYYAMGRWLQNFAYRIHLGILTFVLAGVLALLVALLTVSFQATRAARTNPADCLRYE